MVDLDVPTFRHWSQTIPATGSVIREGAGRGYYGPAPPRGPRGVSAPGGSRDRAPEVDFIVRVVAA